MQFKMNREQLFSVIYMAKGTSYESARPDVIKAVKKYSQENNLKSCVSDFGCIFKRTCIICFPNL